MLSFQEHLETFMRLEDSLSVNNGTLPTFDDAFAWSSDPSQPFSYNNAPATQLTFDNLGKTKRGSRALVLISPETNAPIDHYSDQSNSSSQSTSSDDMTSKSFKFQEAGSIAQGSTTASQLPIGSKLHRWMEPPTTTHVDEPPTMGLYFYGTSSIWNARSVSQKATNGESNNIGFRNEALTSRQGIPQSSRLWTWIGDHDHSIGENSEIKQARHTF